MNEQLIRIAVEADAWCDQHHPDDECYNLKWEEKFAELIVQECVGVVKGGSFLHDQAPAAIFAKECSAAINRHFGVKEARGWVCPKCGVDRTKDVCPNGNMAAVCPMIVTAQGVEE